MKIVYSWEWGAGAGHLRRFSPLANHLRGCGHEVVIVSREIASLPRLFPSGSFPWLQSPDAGRSLTPRAMPICLADLAFNLGFDSTEKIAATFGVWKQILGSIQPDLLIADFGIASLAVASAMGIPTARIGTGYTCPPFGDACLPMEDVDGLDEQEDSFAAARNSSQELLQAIHIALNSVGLSDQIDWRNLLPSPDRTLLATLPPLDPYRSYRSQSEYLGVWQPDGETKPEWSQSNRGRVVAYLKPFRWLPELLRMLASMGLETILYGDGIPESLIAPVRGPLLKVSSHPLHFSNIGDRCTFAICNANHGTTSKLLAMRQSTDSVARWFMAKPDTGMRFVVLTHMRSFAMVTNGLSWPSWSSFPTPTALLLRQFWLLCIAIRKRVLPTGDVTKPVQRSCAVCWRC